MLTAELASLRRQLADLEAENEDLRNELNAFDPAFWDEVMDMKQQHGELAKRAAHYEDVIVELSGKLGVAPPLQGRAGDGGGRRGGARGSAGRPPLGR